jgi:hypothetical protein
MVNQAVMTYVNSSEFREEIKGKLQPAQHNLHLDSERRQPIQISFMNSVNTFGKFRLVRTNRSTQRPTKTYFTKVYPKVSGLTAWNENCKWHNQLYRYSVSQSSEFCRHNTLCCFSTSVYCCKRIFCYRLSPETFEYTLVYIYIYIYLFIYLLPFHGPQEQNYFRY